jgi:coproporphyrinogen III oxidase
MCHSFRAAIVALATLFFAAPVFAGAHTSGGYKPKPVSMEKQLELREYLDGFIADMDKKYFGRMEKINGSLEFEELIRENEWSEYDIQVARGEVMEKTGRMLSRGKKLSPGRGDGVLTWGRFYSLDMHPKTPLVGMLHATIVMQMFEDNTVSTGGWLGVMPGTRVEVDLARLKKLTDDYFAERGKDPSLYRRLICKGTEDTIAEFRRKPACSGVSFYGPPVYPGDPEASIKFIANFYDLFVDEFVNITVERSDDAFTEADLLAQEQMRRRWLIDQLFSDPFASKIVPFEIWSFANVPPVIKF